MNYFILPGLLTTVYMRCCLSPIPRSFAQPDTLSSCSMEVLLLTNSCCALRAISDYKAHMRARRTEDMQVIHLQAESSRIRSSFDCHRSLRIASFTVPEYKTSRATISRVSITEIVLDQYYYDYSTYQSVYGINASV